jgi:hypothetical protein
MRSFYLTALACVLTTISFAQINLFAKPKQPIQFQNAVAAPDADAIISIQDKTIILPLDNMPCLVADAEPIAAIPNAVPSLENNTIPNASPKPQLLTPAFKNNTQPLINDAYSEKLFGSAKRQIHLGFSSGR